MKPVAPGIVIAAMLTASPVPAFAQVDERVIYASVVDKNGDPVSDLTDKDFIIREDGQTREILRVARDTDPLQIALLVDNSAGMRNKDTDLRKAVAAFIDGTREGVQIAMITMASRPTISVNYTTDHQALKKAVDRLFSDTTAGNTFLDAVAETSQGFTKRTGSRAVIAAITTPEDLSFRQYTEVLDYFREGGAALHVLTLGANAGSVDHEMVVGKATTASGGRNEIVLSSMGLPAKAKQLATELSNQYRITYARPQRLIPPRETTISARRADLRARGTLVKTEQERR
jgi:hypothetical protein